MADTGASGTAASETAGGTLGAATPGGSALRLRISSNLCSISALWAADIRPPGAAEGSPVAGAGEAEDAGAGGGVTTRRAGVDAAGGGDAAGEIATAGEVVARALAAGEADGNGVDAAAAGDAETDGAGVAVAN